MTDFGIVNSVVNAVKECAVNEAKTLARVGDRIMVMNDRLEWLQTFIRDAEQKRRSKESPFIAVWVRQTRDVAFQVEDVLDDYFRKARVAEMEGSSRWKACFKCLIHPFTKLFILDNLAKRMNIIEKRLTEISDNKDRYKFVCLEEPSFVWTSSSTTNLAAWDNLEEDMIGFEDYQKILKEQLIGPGTDPRAMITSIIGKSGTGKTMLARKVFDCEEVQKHFEIRSWVLLPPKYRVTEIIGKIHRTAIKAQKQRDKKNVQSNAGKDISDLLSDELRPFRYLVLLDGMASIVDWNIIKAALPDVGNGSRVLITMQSDCEGVENLVEHSNPPLKIEPLDEVLSKRLFLNRVFGKHGKHSYPSWFKETTYGKDVFTLTQGFPLAIVILAGLLRSKESQAEWDSVFQKLKDRKSVKALDRILAMSFDDLPHSLKSCFLYLGALPETKLHNGHKLVRLWISEGFIKQKKGRTLEEIGQQHLKELVSRCLIKLRCKDARGDVKSVVVHDLIHAFVQSEAQGSSFFEIHDNFDVIAPSTVRRLSVQNHTDKYVPLINSFPNLRSLICGFAEKHDNTKVSAPQTNQEYRSLRLFHVSKFLRVIDIKGLLLESLPKEVGGMIHLRYLGVKKCGLKQLPTSICKLIYLQTLDVRDTDANNVDEEFWNILTLRHIFARKIKPPKSMKTKDNIQTLHGVDCASCFPASLGEANNIRSLELEGLSNSHSEALLVALSKLELLAHLKLKCLEGESITSCIFHNTILRRLHSLEIDGRLEKAAQERDSMHSNTPTLPNLTELILWHSGICQEFIFVLAKFPSLSCLQLQCSAYHGKTLVFPENGFRSLTELYLSLEELEEWRIENLVMPELVRLYLWQCKSMKMIPDGVKDLSKLKEVSVYGSDMIGERIKENGDDYHKVQHVPIRRIGNWL